MPAITALKYTIAIGGVFYMFWLLIQGLQQNNNKKYIRALLVFLLTAALMFLFSVAEFYYFLHS